MEALRLRPVLLTAAAALVIAVSGSACSGASRPSTGATPPAGPTTATTSSTPIPPPAPSASASDAAERAAVLDAYARFWAEQVKAYAQGASTGTELEKYASDKALGSTRIDLSQKRDQGVVLTGAPKHDPQVEALDAASSPKVATIRDCLDITDWKPVNKATGQPLKVTSPALRFTLVYSARTVGTDWKMVDVSTPDQPC